MAKTRSKGGGTTRGKTRAASRVIQGRVSDRNSPNYTPF